MKIEKNKIVFAAVLTVVVIFLVSYSVMVWGSSDSEHENLNSTLVPELKEEPKGYNSKLDAINDLKEVRETTAPSIYNEKLIDSLGDYNPDLPKLQKKMIIDSIYALGRIQYSQKRYPNFKAEEPTQKQETEVDSSQIKRDLKIDAKELALEHQLFFASNPKESDLTFALDADHFIYVVVDGDQVVKANSRLRMRLSKATTIEGVLYSRNTLIYGFVSFTPNRTMISIDHIGKDPVTLLGYDVQDGSEGIYIENSFQGEAREQVIGDLVEDISVAGVPQLSGIKQLFRRNNKKVKVTVIDGYELILKAPKGQ